MKNSYLLPIALFLCLSCHSLEAQTPQALRSDISIRPYYKFENVPYMPRFVYDASDKSFYAISWAGDLYHLIPNANGTFLNQKIAGVEDHAINYLQGIALLDGTLYLVGNVVVQQNVKGYGKGVKAKLNTGSALKWTEVFKTAEHAASNTLFDHSFSSICFSPDGKDMYIASGSRTDHGEVKDHDGLYPNMREIALTSCIYKLPSNTENLLLPNDSAKLAPYVHVRGVRNAFSLAFNAAGDLFSVENSGERDDPEEMNWIRPGAHYGFPWELGGNDTPMQFPGYKPDDDKLINRNYTGYKIGAFHDDPGFPQKPKNLTYRMPIQNLGPDADKYKDPVTGKVLDASDKGTSITSFTAHRSPLGLAFDNGLMLGGDYAGKGFVLSYQEGTETYGPMEDPSQDLLMLNLKKNAAGDEYVMNAYKIVSGFKEPTDAKIVGNKLYVLQVGGQMWEITFPKETVTALSPSDPVSVSAYPNPVTGRMVVQWSERQHPVHISIVDLSGRVLVQTTSEARAGNTDLDVSALRRGLYILNVESRSRNSAIKILVNP
jgi:hypothetical protein